MFNFLKTYWSQIAFIVTFLARLTSHAYLVGFIAENVKNTGNLTNSRIEVTETKISLNSEKITALEKDQGVLSTRLENIEKLIQLQGNSLYRIESFLLEERRKKDDGK